MDAQLLTGMSWRRTLYSVIALCTLSTGVISANGLSVYIQLAPSSVICSIDDGGSLADLDHIQPNTSLSGYFTYPISCDGTITSVSSYGFCFNSMSVVLLLIVTTLHDGGAATHAYHPLPVECDGSKINGTDYYAGNVSLGNVGIRVSSGNGLSVRFASSCVSHGCLFLPAIANETGNYSLIFYNESIIPSEKVSFSLFFPPPSSLVKLCHGPVRSVKCTLQILQILQMGGKQS